MDIELVSPSGIVSKLAVPFNTRHYYTDDLCFHPYLVLAPCTLFVRLDGEFRFGSSTHLGEDPNGVWTLRLTDHYPPLGGTLRSWSIKVYGHVSRPGPPTITTPITAGDNSLTVAWSAPSDNGGPPITAYDLRYIETSADETVDTNWTVVEGIWTTGFGSLQYVLTGLAAATQYDVQVRAVNDAGAGLGPRYSPERQQRRASAPPKARCPLRPTTRGWCSTARHCWPRGTPWLAAAR